MRFTLPTTITALDIIGLACLFVFVLSVLALAEILRRKDKVSGSTSRKIVHLSVGNVLLVFPFVFSSVWYALIGPVFFIPFTYLTCPGSPIKKFKLKGVEEGHTYGTVFYAIALTALVALFFYPKLPGEPVNQYNIILFGSFMPLVWGDGISAVVGSKYGNDKPYTIFGGTKTLLGSWAAAFATLFSVTISCLILSQTIVVSIYIGLFTGFITAIIEAISTEVGSIFSKEELEKVYDQIMHIPYASLIISIHKNEKKENRLRLGWSQIIERDPKYVFDK